MIKNGPTRNEEEAEVLDDSSLKELIDRLRAEGRLRVGGTPQFVKKLIAEYRSRGLISEEEALRLAKKWAELDDQEGLEVEVVTDEEE